MHNAPHLMNVADVITAERRRVDPHMPTRAAPRRLRTNLGHALVSVGERLAHGRRHRVADCV